ncbi:MAG: IS630 family transposase [Planctomycetota bacterium]
MKQPGMDPAKPVFMNETWAKTNMTRLRGRSPSGRRLVEKVPHGHWKTTPLVAALDHRGMRCGMTVDGAIDDEHFTAFCQQVLAPTLSPGEVVVMDNLSSHKVKGVRDAIVAAEARVLYLPPYSPGYNPIENALSKLNQGLRSAGHRRADQLWSDRRQRLPDTPPSDAAGYFRHCGYTLQTN